MKKILTLVLIAGLALGILTAQNPHVNRAPKHTERSGGMRNMHEELQLTEAQQKKFTEARAAYQRQENSIGAEIKNLNLDLEVALKAENFKRVKELNKQISNKELDLKNARIDLIMAQLKELSAEQKEIWKKQPHMMMHGFGKDQQQPQFRSSRDHRSGNMPNKRHNMWKRN